MSNGYGYIEFEASCLSSSDCPPGCSCIDGLCMPINDDDSYTVTSTNNIEYYGSNRDLCVELVRLELEGVIDSETVKGVNKLLLSNDPEAKALGRKIGIEYWSKHVKYE